MSISVMKNYIQVVTTDYPAAEILDNIIFNISLNSTKLSSSSATIPEVYGHTWGKLDEQVARKYPKAFTRVIAADTLWMDWEHHNLAKSILHFLSDSPSARGIVVAGLHSGRQKMSKFWDAAVEEGLAVESIRERDVDGVERPYMAGRGTEDVVERKRWLIIGTLRKKFLPHET